ncbi:hypothetical protein TNCV_3540931 [Trichonephila clavipes]|nr:hypothetical protein TNCV_3540931 [Trichonephila clavipes]
MRFTRNVFFSKNSNGDSDCSKSFENNFLKFYEYVGRKIGGIPELPTDTLTIGDRRGNPTDLKVKVLVIIGGQLDRPIIVDESDNSRRRSGQSDHRFHNQGDRQGGSRNGALRGQNVQNKHLNF